MAAALAHYLMRDRAALFPSPGVATLELGSGTGAVGLYAAGLGARCTLSEQRPERTAAQPVSYAPDGESSISLNELPGQSDCLVDLLHQNVADNYQRFAIPPAVMAILFMITMNTYEYCWGHLFMIMITMRSMKSLF